MKKILVVCAALSTLLCSPLLAQEADDAGTGVGFSIIPRLDLSPEFTDGKGEFTLGNSSIYTLFEGNITDNLSFSVSNHWASLWGTDPFGQETKDLYNHTLWHSDTVNWLDWAYLSYELGPWTFTLGKNVMLTGGTEYDQYDWDRHPALASSFWNNFAGYQWGGRVGFEFLEGNTLNLEVATSPYGERPFSSGLYAFSAGWNGTIGPWQPLWSFSAIQKGDDKYEPLLYLGNRLVSDKAQVDVDFSNRVGSGEFVLAKGYSIHGTATWPVSEKLDVLATVAYEKINDLDEGAKIGGAAIHWYPFGEDKSLRVHAFCAYNSLAKTATICLGAVYNLNLL